MTSADIARIAAEIVDAHAIGCPVVPFTRRAAGFDEGSAYRVAGLVRAERERTGDEVVGRKLGFTNRAIWRDPPMWGWMYARTVCDGLDATVALQTFAEPRIEPEVVLGLAAAPAPDMDDAALLGCIAWAAHGIEIVQSIYPGWDFAGPDAIAAGGLHGALVIGPRHAPRGDAAEWARALPSFQITLFRDGVEADRGHARDVMGGPLAALRHLAATLAADVAAPPLGAGEIVSTGTLTRALPMRAGETWTTELDGIGLEGMRLRTR